LRRNLLPVVVLVLASVLTAGCRSSGRGTDPTLPPDGTKPVARLYDERLAPLGWRVQRSSLEELVVDGGVPIPPGRLHLAVYLRPLGDPSPAGYVDALASVTRVFAVEVFERYSGLASFDVCLEPTEAQDPDGYPATLTQVTVSRAQASMLDWTTARPADVVAGAERHPNAVGLFVAESLMESPAWAEVRGEVASRPG
jgi:hypothetical protein